MFSLARAGAGAATMASPYLMPTYLQRMLASARFDWRNTLLFLLVCRSFDSLTSQSSSIQMVVLDGMGSGDEHTTHTTSAAASGHGSIAAQGPMRHTSRARTIYELCLCSNISRIETSLLQKGYY